MSYTVIALIINVLFAVILVAGFFVGFWRGVKKSAVNVIFAVAGVLVAFFVAVPVTNAILSIQLPQGSIKDVILNMVLSQESIKSLVQQTPSLQALIEGIPTAVASTVVFVLLAVLVESVMYLLFKIFAIIFLRNKKVEGDQPKPKKHRLWGGVIGLAKTLVLTVFVLTPLTSLVSLASDLTKTGDYFVEASADQNVSTGAQEGNIITQNLPQVAIDGINAFHNSAFGFLGGLGGFDNLVFDYYATVNVDGQNVSLRQEISQYWKVYDIYSQVSQIGTEGFEYTFKDLDFDKLDECLDGILNSGLYKTVLTDTLTSVVTNYDENGILPQEIIDQYGDILAAVKGNLEQQENNDEYFSNDIKLVFGSFKELCKAGVVDKIRTLESSQLGDIITLLADEQYSTALQTTLINLFDTNIIRAGAKPFGDLILNMVIPELEKIDVNVGEFDKDTWHTVATNLSDVIVKAQSVLNGDLPVQEILQDPLTLLDDKYDMQKVLANLAEIIDLLRVNPLFKNGEQSLIDLLLTKYNFALPANQIEINGKMQTIDTYAALFNDVLYPPMQKIKDAGIADMITGDQIDKTALFTKITDQIAENENFLADIILPLYQVNITKELVVDNIFASIQTQAIDFSKLTSYQLWKDDLKQISTLLLNLQNITVGGQNGIAFLLDENNQAADFLKGLAKSENYTTPTNPEYAEYGYRTNGDLTSIIKPMFKAVSTRGMIDNIFSTIKTSLQNLTDKNDLKLELTDNAFDSDDDQTDEICNILENFLAIYDEYAQNSGEKLEQLNKENLGMLLDALKDNRYREGGTGVFADTFDTLVGYVKDKIPGLSTVLTEESAYKDKNFRQLLSSLSGIGG